ncbi:MAG: ATP-binding protein [Candidatus Micrarchaeota archaeon]|nr:ATP-binding protein [Candidatus Micrarchaeota archaeon]
MRLTQRDFHELKHDSESQLSAVSSFAHLIGNPQNSYGLQPNTLASLKSLEAECQRVPKLELPLETEGLDYGRHLEAHYFSVVNAADSIARLTQHVHRLLMADSKHSNAGNNAEKIAEFAGFMLQGAQKHAAFARSLSGRRKKIGARAWLDSIMKTKHAASLSTSGRVPDVSLQVNELLLERVMDNLIRNAERHANAENIQFKGERHGDFLHVYVQNDGTSMGPNVDKNQIFKEFYTTHAEGTGLGLPFSKRVVEDHGGTLELLESKPGKTVFQIRLPIVGTNAHVKSESDRRYKALTELVFK